MDKLLYYLSRYYGLPVDRSRVRQVTKSWYVGSLPWNELLYFVGVDLMDFNGKMFLHARIAGTNLVKVDVRLISPS